VFNVDQFLKRAQPRSARAAAAPPPPKGTKPRRPWQRLKIFGLAAGGLTAAAALFILVIFAWFGRGLPDISQLENYQPKVVTRIHAGDGTLLTEYATEKRLFVPIDAVPPMLIDAYLAAEDKNFYTHPGIDFIGLMRSVFINIGNVFSDRRPVGGSTITQQVAKNFLLSSETTYERKIKEAILSFRMEKAYDKNQILELYMNDVYLGFGSYGVAAAAQNYFGKALDELTLPEMAYLAALLKAPSNYHPIRYPEAALGRRNVVLDLMLDAGFITKQQHREAVATPLNVNLKGGDENFRADYFGEEVRRQLLAQYGESELYGGGLSVHTSLDPRLETIAERELRKGLENYDRRYGWRGALARIDIKGDWSKALGDLAVHLGVPTWRAAVVLGFENGGAVLGFEGRTFGFLPLAEAKWARAARPDGHLGPAIGAITEVVQAGDVVPVEALKEGFITLTSIKERDGRAGVYGLRQVPEIEGALVAMDPHTGRVLAMVGGFDFETSQFNRATQALRQPGSAFKPIVYAAALEAGLTPSTLILDAPYVIDQGAGQGKWKPRNSSNVYYGPSTLRLGLEKSRNLMTVRLAQYMGMDKIIGMAKRFGVGDNVPPTLAGALGAGEVTLLKLTAAYAMIVNGGYRIEPSLIDRVQNRRGLTVYKKDQRPCEGCLAAAWDGQPLPTVPDTRERVLDSRIAYQLVSLMEGVVRNGTGRQASSLGIPLGGKTGTTNDATDAWFIGFSPDLVVGVYTGFDKPRSLGEGEEGSSIAVPVFRDFMGAALKGMPALPFRIPAGVRLVRVNADTGQIAQPGDAHVILEAFLPGTEPSGPPMVLDGQGFIRADFSRGDEDSGIY
jgi:penicillin-binding protein 1A